MMQTIGHYRILETIGSGGMGTVYRALHIPLDRAVALKVMQPSLADEQVSIARFRREMQITGMLNHPNLVKILDGGYLDGTLYIAMELLEGEPFDALVKRLAPLPWKRAAMLMRMVADALGYLHAQKCVHRDIKPSNIFLLSDQTVKLIDFGLAQIQGLTVVTAAGELMGTVAFMAPEVADGGGYTPEADLYSAGCVFYVLLTGELPYGEQLPAEYMARAHTGRFEPPGKKVRLPAALNDLVVRLLSTEPVRRGNAQAFAAALDAVLGRSPAVAPPSHRALQATFVRFGIVLILLASLLGIWFWPTPDTKIPVVAARESAKPVRVASVTSGQPYLHLLPRLKKGGPDALAAVRFLQAHTPLELGSAKNWILWLELEEWLSGANNDLPARVTHALPERPDALADSALATGMDWMDQRSTSRPTDWMSTTLMLLNRAPRNVTAWLQLSKIYKADGRPDLAARIGRLALYLGPECLPERYSRSAGEALVEALLAAGNHRLENEWASWFCTTSGEQVWDALEQQLGRTDPARYITFLQALTYDPKQREWASARLGEWWTPRDLLTARAIWQQGLDACPRSQRLAEHLVVFELHRGELAEARRLMTIFPSTHHVHSLIRLPKEVPDATAEVPGALLWPSIRRLMILGQPGAAAAMIRKNWGDLRKLEFNFVVPPMMSLLDTGQFDKWLLDFFKDASRRDLGQFIGAENFWDELLSCCSRPKPVVLLEQLRSRAIELLTKPAQTLINATLASRRQDYDRSVELLSQAGLLKPDPRWSEWTVPFSLEIIARAQAHRERLLSSSVATLDHLTADRKAPVDLQRLAGALAEQKWGLVSRLARAQFLRTPDRSAWGRLVLYAAFVQRDAVALTAWRERLEVASVYSRIGLHVLEEARVLEQLLRP